MMPLHSIRTAKLLAAGMFALAVAVTPAAGFLYSAPAAGAEGVPDPAPVPVPVPELDVQPGNSAGCQPGESLNPENGNCEPTMSPVPADSGDAAAVPPTSTTGETTRTIDSGEPADLVPNINGDSCTGYWESTVCYAEQGQAAVQPKSTISSSP
jgi:hypothetical protein